MKNVLNLKFILLLAISSAFLMGCEKDDDDEKSGNNTVVYNGTTYTIKDGLVNDYGAFDPIDQGENTHYNYDFVVVDDELVQYTEDGYTFWEADTTNASIFYIYAELFSPGTSSFQTGTFTFKDYEAATAENIDGEFFFTDAYVGFVKYGDDEEGYEATGGTIKVSGSNLNYTIEYDLTLPNSKTAKGSFSGTFKYDDNRDMLLLKKK